MFFSVSHILAGMAFIWIFRAAASGLVAYATPRVLKAWGVPLDEWIITGSALVLGAGNALNSEAALWAVSLILGLALFGIESWWQPIAHLFKTLHASLTHLQLAV
jgi:hypothetical protein